MPARGAIYTLLAEDTKLKELGVEAFYHANQVDTPEEQVFGVIRHEGKARVFGNVGPETATVWIHDRQDTNYGRVIDPALERVKELLGAAVHRPGPDGWVLTQADWRSDSNDLVDGGYGSITRWADFGVISRYSSSE